LERDLAERIRTWLADLTPRLVTYDSSRDDDRLFGLGLGCRGIIELLVEPFDAARPPRLVTHFQWNDREPVEWTTTLPDGEVIIELIRSPRAVAIFGNGPDVAPVAQLARTVGWRVDVITTRDPIELHHYDAAIVMTHNFERDVAIVSSLHASPIPYVGLLGPKSRGDELLASIDAANDSRFHTPIGLDLGAETPEEIALSIVAEIQSAFARRSARPLRELNVPIHDRVVAIVLAAGFSTRLGTPKQKSFMTARRCSPAPSATHAKSPTTSSSSRRKTIRTPPKASPHRSAPASPSPARTPESSLRSATSRSSLPLISAPSSPATPQSPPRATRTRSASRPYSPHRSSPTSSPSAATAAPAP
jgi:xanthine/CO dehydrogenase XdhC/CoxF family maturation factor